MLIADSRETNTTIVKGCDRQMALTYRRPEAPEHAFSYDLHVIADKDPRHGVREFRFERKAWPDFVQSWLSGYLERQLEAVDGLVVEYDPFAIMVSAPKQEDGEDEMAYKNRLSIYHRTQRSAEKHLMKVAANMWVIPSRNPECTIDLMRDLERNADVAVRQNRIKGKSEAVHMAVLRQFPGINPDNLLPSGRRLGEVIWDSIDRAGLVAALNLMEWTRIDMTDGVAIPEGGKRPRGIGLSTVQKVAEALMVAGGARPTGKDSPAAREEAPAALAEA